MDSDVLAAPPWQRGNFLPRRPAQSVDASPPPARSAPPTDPESRPVRLPGERMTVPGATGLPPAPAHAIAAPPSGPPDRNPAARRTTAAAP